MICSVCQSENDVYSSICTACGSFLQNRVPHLDLFDTLWKIFENPKEAFQLIMRAEHKNYVLFLYCLYGVLLTLMGFAQYKMGDRFENILFLFFWACVIGVPSGGILGIIIPYIHWLLVRVIGGKGSFHASRGITGYAFSPLVISLIIIIPIKIMTFGMYFFTSNPHPLSLKPISYFMLLGLDSLVFLWILFLQIYGTCIGNQLSTGKSFSVTAVLLGVAAGLLYFGGNYFMTVI